MQADIRAASQRILLCLSAVLAAATPARADCPAMLTAAQRVILVTAPDMGSVKASLRRFERRDPGGTWREVAAATSAVVGLTGLGWAPGDESAAGSEPRKQEGDRRTPAGLFRLGRPFGQGPSSLAGYLRLEPGRDICVDDPSSPRYGQIIPRTDDPKVHGEDMGRVSLYRRGFVIDYPVSAAARSGSCIFLHVWRGPDKGTVGCVAAPEPTVALLQDWAKPGDVVAILPKPRADAVLACLGSPAATP